MLPAGKITEDTIATLAGMMKAGDTIIDGGNTMFKDDVRRARELKPKGIHYLDVGTSGGVWGLQRGYCLMIGGDKAAVDRLDPIFSALAPGLGDDRAHGTPRSSRFARRARLYPRRAGGRRPFREVIHNGIEYGMMQAFAEGFDIMKHRASAKLPADERFDLTSPTSPKCGGAAAWSPSWLLDLTASALARDGQLEAFLGSVEDSGEGR
jgi:6-phosphogluconate dehydrogenase